MTRMSKQGKRRALSPLKHKRPAVKTGPQEDRLENGYKKHLNALEGDQGSVFIAKIK